MSRKHFTAVAAAIKTQIDEAQLPSITELDNIARKSAFQATVRIAQEFARIAASDNPRFDTQRFLRACGISKFNS